MEQFLSLPTISSKGTPKMMRGFENLCHTKIFSRLLHSLQPDSSKLQNQLLTNKHLSGQLIENKAYQEPLSVRHERLQVYKHALSLSVNTEGESNSHLRIRDSQKIIR